ncbi:MAG: porin, partial [Alistipes sp.]|nr:porin [Alistipes sp.]
MKLKYYFLAIAALVVSLSASAQSNSTFAKDYMSLSGYLQGGFQTPGVGGDEPSSTFYLKRARVSLTGNVPQDNIDYRLQVDMAGSPKICDLYFRYKPSAAFNVQLGQFKIPFAIENDIYGPTTVEFIDYSYITTLLARNADRFDGISAGGRDIGFQVYGGFGEARGYNILSYNLGIFNGAGINKADNNDAKDVVARVIVKPSKALSLSASWMSAETIFEERNLRSDRWSAGVIYDVDDFIVRSEYAEAEFGDDDIDAFYVMGGYKIKKNWMLVARYETLNQEYERDADTYANRFTLGAVYKPYSFLRLQLNYAIEKSGLESSRE